MKKILFFSFLFSLFSFLFAGDFGLLLDQNAGYGGIGAEGGFDYAGALIPRYTLLLENGEVYASAGVTAEYQNEAWIFAPELLRTEILLNFGDNGLKAGRMQYTDPLGLIADGLFDGAQVFFDTGAGIFSAQTITENILHRCEQSGIDCAAGIAGAELPEKVCAETLLQQATAALRQVLAQQDGKINVYREQAEKLSQRKTLVHSHEKRFLFSGGE